MTKKLVLGLAVLVCTGGLLFSQENGKNTVALYGGLVSLAANYERQLSPHFSVLADASVNLIGLFTYTAAAKARWYPSANVFFLEMGAGYGRTKGFMGMVAEGAAEFLSFGKGDFGDDFLMEHALVITPGVGWKVDLGRPGGFVLPVGLGVDFFFGPRGIPWDFVPNLRVGLGYSF